MEQEWANGLSVPAVVSDPKTRMHFPHFSWLTYYIHTRTAPVWSSYRWKIVIPISSSDEGQDYGMDYGGPF